jgi:hypothetical protein
MSQTAVEWLVHQVNSDCLNSAFIRPELVEQAKAMEKEQREEAIELPSDEEIEELMNKNGYYEQDYDDIWREGAKWMKEQILNQKKEKQSGTNQPAF